MLCCWHIHRKIENDPAVLSVFPPQYSIVFDTYLPECLSDAGGESFFFFKPE